MPPRHCCRSNKSGYIFVALWTGKCGMVFIVALVAMQTRRCAMVATRHWTGTERPGDRLIELVIIESLSSSTV